MRYLDFARRVRLPLGFLLGGAYLVFARPTSLGLVTGGAIALAGVLVRGWAAGHIEKNDRLAVSGPYAHTRNPLYLGSFLIAAGFAVAVHWAMLLLVVAFFVLVYAPNIERERQHIRERFGAEYDEYAANVPAFVPRGIPWRQAQAGHGRRFSWRLYLRHREWQAGATYLLVMAWLAFRLAQGF
jgi:protein-S-isoprenylcysteine O-methyltransferase Ste14